MRGLTRHSVTRGAVVGVVVGIVVVMGIARPARAQVDTATLLLTESLAVTLALEHNLGLQAERLSTQVADLEVARARTTWTPTAFSTLVQNSSSSPSTSLLTGPKAIDDRASLQTGLAQRLPWGTAYQIAWDGATRTTNNVLARFNPELTSGLAISISQSLTQAFGIDGDRTAFRESLIARRRADDGVDAAVAMTTRRARRAFWEWSYALDVAEVQQQSLDLARELLRENRQRVATGALAATDVIEAEAEVARREESVLVAANAVATTEDALRRVILDPRERPATIARDRTSPDAMTLEAAGALERAVERRYDLLVLRRQIESEDLGIRLADSNARPDVTVRFDYSAQSQGGTELLRIGGFPGTVVGTAERSFGAAQRDVWANRFPTWSVQLGVSYPVGTGVAEAARAVARVRRRRAELALADAELEVRTQVAATVREAGTNRQRIDATRASVALAERRLDAEQRKFTAGLSTSFFVFQAQRDLATARETALRAVLDYHRSAADVDAVQVVPLAGAGEAILRQ